MQMIRRILPVLYITWIENGKEHEAGPFWTISPSGCDVSTTRSWFAYEVQTKSRMFTHIIIPTRYHTIVAKNDISYDDSLSF